MVHMQAEKIRARTKQSEDLITSKEKWPRMANL